MDSPSKVVTAFMQAIEARDLDEAVRYLASDAVFDNVPAPDSLRIAKGPEEILSRLRPALTVCTRTEWEVLRQVEADGTVFNERVDRFWFEPGVFPKGDVIEWPCAGRWDVEDGLIKLWRDYYYPERHTAALGVTMLEYQNTIRAAYASRH